MNWTTEKPTKPGLYRHKGPSDEVAYMVMVTEINGLLVAEEPATCIARLMGTIDGLDGEWQGPLDKDPKKPMTWSRLRPTLDGWYWIRYAAAEGWEAEAERQVVRVYGCVEGHPSVTLPSAENCSHLADIDAEWAGPLPWPEG